MALAHTDPAKLRQDRERLENLEDLVDRLQADPAFASDASLQGAINEELRTATTSTTGGYTVESVREMSVADVRANLEKIQADLAGRAAAPSEPQTIEDVRSLDHTTIVDNGWVERVQEIVARETAR